MHIVPSSSEQSRTLINAWQKAHIKRDFELLETYEIEPRVEIPSGIIAQKKFFLGDHRHD